MVFVVETMVFVAEKMVSKPENIFSTSKALVAAHGKWRRSRKARLELSVNIFAHRSLELIGPSNGASPILLVLLEIQPFRIIS